VAIPSLVGKVDCHRPPESRKIIQQESRHIEIPLALDGAQVLMNVSVKNLLQSPLVRINISEGTRLKQQ
jgi:hypothetical protein